MLPPGGCEGSLVFLTGEAGIGKTRLAHELRSYVKVRWAQLLTGRGYEQEGAIPYRPWVDIISEYLRWAPPMTAKINPTGGPLAIPSGHQD